MGIIKPTEIMDIEARRYMPVLELNTSPSVNHCKANVVTVNLMVLKNHVLKQDALAFGYLSTAIGLVMQLIVHSNGGLPQARPAALNDIHSSAQKWLKKPHDTKDFTRSYVRLWCRLVCYIANKYDYHMAEYLMTEAYNRMAAKKPI